MKCLICNLECEHIDEDLFVCGHGALHYNNLWIDYFTSKDDENKIVAIYFGDDELTYYSIECEDLSSAKVEYSLYDLFNGSVDDISDLIKIVKKHCDLNNFM